MKILILSELESIHTIKWARALAKDPSIEVILLGIGHLSKEHHDFFSALNIQAIGLHSSINRSKNDLLKLQYLKNFPRIRKEIHAINPDIIHAHYATSYGVLGATSNFHPFILSVWGSDVFDFPKKSFFHRKLLEYNLRKADAVLSTSHVMARETNLYSKKEITVTPFGIDLNEFKPMPSPSLFNENDIVIGTIKTLEEKYGIEYLIRAFHILNIKHPELPLKLMIVGGGSLENKLKTLADNLSIGSKTIFVGKVPHQDIPKYHNMLDVSVSVSVSNSESFGVAIIEASACGKPVVVSNVGGLPEVVEDGVTGIIVPPRNAEATANAIERLVLNKELRLQMGKAGRERVKRLYNWDDNVKQMINIYKEILEKH